MQKFLVFFLAVICILGTALIGRLQLCPMRLANQSPAAALQWAGTSRLPSFRGGEQQGLSKIQLGAERTAFEQCLAALSSYPGPFGIHNCCGQYWNELVRFSDTTLGNFPVPVRGIFVDIGASKGLDSSVLIGIYRPSLVHLVEPMPKFVEVLKSNPNTSSVLYPAHLRRDVVYHQMAIGPETRPVFISDEGWASNVQPFKDALHTIEVRQVTASVFLAELPLQSEIDILNINCEGCEWEILESLLTLGLLENVKVFQLGTHNNMKPLDTIKPLYCRFRARLSISHELDPKSMFWAWERWIRKDYRDWNVSANYLVS